MLSSTALKALTLWKEALNRDDTSEKDLERVQTVAKKLERTVVEPGAGGVNVG